MIKKIDISVPGCIGNLGSGFDCLGLSIKLYNRFIFEYSSRFSVSVSNSEIEKNQNNLCFKAFKKAMATAGKEIPKIKINIYSSIPPGAGMGSSGTAVLAGIIAALLFSRDNLEPAKIFKIAENIEGHLDNIAASFFGGLVIIAQQDDQFIWKKFKVHPETNCVFFISGKSFSTKQARSILPEKVPLSDTVFNLSRVGLVPFAFLEKNKKLLSIALNDRLHQPYRSRIYPHFDILYESAMEHGAAGCCLSGAGPSVVAFCFGSPDRVVKGWTTLNTRMNLNGTVRVIKPGGKATWKVY